MIRTRLLVALALTLAAALVLPAVAKAQRPAPAGRPEDTEQWSPVPPVIAPGATAGAAPPADAIRLFDGANLNEWVSTNGGGPARWRVTGGVLTVNKPTGNIETRRRFTNYQLHIEWRIPADIGETGQSRGNSGLFLASTGPGDAGYELQILDSYRNTTYVNGQAGSVCKQAPPLVNASRPPGEWQTYDVVWTARTFAPNGSARTPAYVTALHNGVLIQNHVALKGETVHIGAPSYKRHGPSPIKLQAHGDPSIPISFRNIWLRPL